MVSKRSSQGAGSPQRRTSRWKVEYYVTGSGASPVLEWVKKLPEPKRVAWLAFVEFALGLQGKEHPFRSPTGLSRCLPMADARVRAGDSRNHRDVA